MKRTRSAIITTILVLAIVALAFFAVVSIPYADGSRRLNSVLSTLSLGSEFTGNAETVIYPEGVVSEAEYRLYLPSGDDYDGDTEAFQEDYDEYVAQYKKVGNVYIDTETYESDEDIEDLKDQVKTDAEVIDSRLSTMNYSSYSVKVYGDYGIKISVPTGYSYADYVHSDYLGDENGSSTKLSYVSSILSMMAYQGDLTLRTEVEGFYQAGYNTFGNYSLFRGTADLSGYFKKASYYSYGGNYAVKFKMTSDGRDQLKTATDKLAASETEDATILFYVGESQLLSLSVSGEIDSRTFYITVDNEYQARGYSAVINSVVNDEVVELVYNSENTDGISVVAVESVNGKYTALACAIAALVLIIAVCVAAVLIYKKLGWIHVLMTLSYAIVVIYAAFFMELEITLAVLICAMLGLALLTMANFVAFESVRTCVKEGHVIRNAVKQGYRNCLAKFLDMHILLFIAAMIVAFVGAGAVSACGFIFSVATAGSYALYWFTRFMWYLLSDPVRERDKYKFCGFKRKEGIEEDD